MKKRWEGGQKGGRKEGKEGRKEERKEGRKEGRKERRKVLRKEEGTRLQNSPFLRQKSESGVFERVLTRGREMEKIERSRSHVRVCTSSVCIM